jgi:predicted Ser/Thr protein kinase/tetratricopeptide (TPR) repeat protein
MTLPSIPREVRLALEGRGTDWGTYVLIKRVGAGGMGEVFRAWDKALGRIVALKLIKEITPEGVARFEREAQLAARLHHPNIATIFGVGEHQGRRYMAMQFIEGTTLEQCKAGLGVLLGAMEDAARAVDYAHGNGVIHRDINPRNLMIDPGKRGFVTDFGIARWAAAGATVTQTGMLLGTPAYMSPEQAGGEEVDARTDIYSLGATLYFAATQSAPHYGDAPMQVLRRVREDEPILPRVLNPKVGAALEEIILHAMQKEPAARYARAAALADDLHRYRRTGRIRGRPWYLRLRPKPVTRRRGLAAIALAAAVGAGAFFVWWRMRPPAPEPVNPMAPARQIVSDFARLPQATPREIEETRQRLEEELKPVERRFPSEAWLLRGEFNWHAGMRPEALDAVEKSVNADPKNAIAYLWKARILLRDYLTLRSEAESRVQLISLLGGFFGPERRSEADQRKKMKQLVTDGNKALKEFLRRSPSAGAEQAFAEGVQNFYDQKDAEAEGRLAEATASSFLSRDAYLLLAIVRTFQGRYGPAEEDLSRARTEGLDYLRVRAMLALRMLVEVKDREMRQKSGVEEARGALLKHLRVLLEAEPDPGKWDWLTRADPRIRSEMGSMIELARKP